MKIIRYLESHEKPNDTMFVEIDGRYRFTGKGRNWAKFRGHLVKVIRSTISDDMADEFERETQSWVNEAG